MQIHTPPMTFVNDEGKAAWEKDYEANKDGGYGEGILRFASEWATLMERAADGVLTSESPLETQIAFMVAYASSACRAADDEGITGFMYGVAVGCLAHAWVYGEALRRWHNKDTQIGTEGDSANESGGVLNPALLNIAVRS